MFYRAYLYGANFIAKFQWESGFLWVLDSGGIKAGGGSMGHSPQFEALPPSTCPSVEKNGQNQPFLEIFGFLPPQKCTLPP